ncbi:MAG: deoxyribonuclease IV [Candidatus Omnitrophica bacterium]|nr:deoxyribonuclease IV [Candidatus Omnitrophota bacterium]MBU2044209.1 deoxyribonuclease IV [Candidatus Omnitrophota bacterium]MBU2473293.1 deoxyribonuclease IV [Candidatus Omnitrophota bacterium]
MLKIGVHVSIAGKIYKSPERAAELGCNTMQIFSRNPRQWRKSEIEEEDVVLFKDQAKEFGIDPVVIHIPYTLNLASAKKTFHKITIRDFIVDLIEADRLGAAYLITHMGSYKGSTETAGLLRVVNALKKILKETEGVNTRLLLENTSGSGSWLGCDFSHQRFVFQELDWNKRVGICLDTAHAWAAGYKINDAVGFNGLLRDIESKVGIERLGVIHLNDTEVELGSRLDRHFDIGQGKIGKKGFSAMINNPKLKKIPFILETPKKDDSDDKRNLAVVRTLVKQK